MADIDVKTILLDGQVLGRVGADLASVPLPTAAVRVGCSVYRATARSFAHAGETVPWDGEAFDTNGFHDNSTNPERLTVPTGQGGLYLVVAGLKSSVVGGSEKRWIQSLTKNNTAIRGGTVEVQQRSTSPSAVSVSVVVEAAAADYFAVDLYQDATFGLAMDLAACAFSCTRLSA
jgi:hypothetical protein